MMEVRWRRGSVPPLLVLLLGVGLLLAPGSVAASAPARAPASLVACAAGRAATAGSWFRRVSHADGRGWLRGYTLLAGRPDGSRTVRVRLHPESFVAPPVRGVLVYGTDDGSRSEVHLVRLADGCDAMALRSEAVVRRATLDPSGRTVYLHLVDRASRADLGIWQRPADAAGRLVPVMPGLPDPVGGPFGRTFLTLFTWSAAGRTLAVQSCGEDACRTRLLDIASGAVTLDASPGQGELIALGDAERFGYRADCHGFPCPIDAIGSDGSRRTLVAAAGVAAFAAGRIWYESPNADGTQDLRYADPAGHHDHSVKPGAGRLAWPARWADAAVELPDGWIGLTANGTWASPADVTLGHLEPDLTLRRSTVQGVTR